MLVAAKMLVKVLLLGFFVIAFIGAVNWLDSTDNLKVVRGVAIYSPLPLVFFLVHKTFQSLKKDSRQLLRS